MCGREAGDLCGGCRVDAEQDVFEICGGVDAAQFAGNDQGVKDRGAPAAVIVAEEKIVLATESYFAQRVFTAIVVCAL